MMEDKIVEMAKMNNCSIKQKFSFVHFIILFMVSHPVFSQDYVEQLKGHREKYLHDFLVDERSPIKNKEDLKHIHFFDADESFIVKAEFIRTENAIPFEMPTMNGKMKRYIEYGILNFVLQGKKFSLHIYQNVALLENPEYVNHLFLPFTDETNGDETYGGGRYLDFQTEDIKDNELILDFNKAYNPYCAFASGYSCPKPPEENDLQIAIRAGEKKFGKGH
jgi:uncharacterized protein (DUF1684 family)